MSPPSFQQDESDRILLEDIVSTARLDERPSRPPDFERENRALSSLLTSLARSPETILQKLIDTTRELTGAGSAGISVLENVDGQKVFKWRVTSGEFKPLAGASLPRDFSPCGIALDRNSVLLMTEPVRFYPYIEEIKPAVEELLLVPFFQNNHPAGTIWVVSHSTEKVFDREDARIIGSLSKFASAAVGSLSAIEKADAAHQSLIAEADVRRRTEFELADVRRRLDASLISGAIATWVWDIADDKIFADRNLAALYGLSDQDANGGPMRNFLKAVFDDDRERVFNDITQAVARGSSYSSEFRLLNGKRMRWVVARGQTERDADGVAVRMTGVVLDITERILAERDHESLSARIEQQSLIYDTVLSSLTDFAYVFDRQGKFLFANRALLELWGLTLEQAVGKDFYDLKYPADLAAKLHRQVEQVFTTGKGLTDETPYTSPTGAGGYYEYIFTPVLSAEGTVQAVVGSTRDISTRKRLEVEREQLLSSERAARNEAERAGRMKDEFLATLSHELRTPLTAIMGWAHVLRTSPADPSKIAQGIETIDRNARAQREIIEDLLDMSRIISGKVRLDLQRVDLAAVAQAALETVTPAAEAKGVHLQVVFDSSAGPVSGDPNRLQQAFWNLLSNAIKFTPSGGQVQMTIAPVHSHLEVSVTDTGEGIQPEFLPYVFDRFRQADGSATRKHGGLGLGLAIVKQLIELHGGTIRVTSPGRGLGSTFTIELPLTAVQSEYQPRPATRAPGARESVVQSPEMYSRIDGVKILVVDDELDARQLIRRLLEDCGAVVETAGSANEAIERFNLVRPDILVSDVGMPGEDGYTMIGRIRAIEKAEGWHVPAIALTAYARSEDRTRAIIAGFQMHLSKPIEPAELIASIASLAQRS